MATAGNPTVRGREPRPGKKYFTLEEARRSLPLVKRIALDMQGVQALRITLHEQMSARVHQTPRELELLEARFTLATERLEGLIEELGQIGVELKDASLALLDFPAFFQGREILLCWRGGEETITHWHELNAGYAGRKPVELLTGNS